jgi:hypothetical protein
MPWCDVAQLMLAMCKATICKIARACQPSFAHGCLGQIRLRSELQVIMSKTALLTTTTSALLKKGAELCLVQERLLWGKASHIKRTLGNAICQVLSLRHWASSLKVP